MSRFDPSPQSPLNARSIRPAAPRVASSENQDAPHPERTEGRRAGRLRCSMIGSNQGEVLDISATGARIQLRRAPDIKAGDCFMLDIDALSGTLKINCCAVWIRLNAERKFEMGVEFRDLSDQTKKKLVETVLHPTRAETLRRGWNLIPEPIDDETGTGC